MLFSKDSFYYCCSAWCQLSKSAATYAQGKISNDHRLYPSISCPASQSSRETSSILFLSKSQTQRAEFSEARARRLPNVSVSKRMFNYLNAKLLLRWSQSDIRQTPNTQVVTPETPAAGWKSSSSTSLART